MRRVTRTMLAVAVLAAAAGCDPAPGSTSRPVTTGAASTPSTGVIASPAGVPDSTLAPEPTGVPGIDDRDPFCAAWAVFAGSVQALAVAAAFGELGSDEMAALELRAAPSMVAAFDAIGSTFPQSLALERDDVLDTVLGPSGRRARRGLDELTTVGVDAAGIDSIRLAWLQSMATRPGDEPLIGLPPLGQPLDDLLTVASRNFDAAVTPYAQDPSLIVADMATPLTDAYLAEACPAVAASGVGDSL